MSQKILYPLPNLNNDFERKSLSTKRERINYLSSAVPPPKAPVRSCPVIRTESVRRRINLTPQPVSFRDDSHRSFIAESSMYISNRGTYFEQCFTTESTLGKGAFGKVFKVYSKETGKPYACKRTILKYKGDTDRLERIDEVKKHEQLPIHLNCVQFFRAWEERNHLYILIEVCTSSLADIMARKHEFPETQIWSYLVDILQGLHHLHEHKLIHMDVKPENIFIGLDGLCKIGDFGLVIDFSRGYPTEADTGDSRYLAPECIQNIYSPAADIFSLGIVLLEMATDLFLPGHGPLWDSLRKGSLPQVAKTTMSEELQFIVKGFVNPDHNKRFTSQSTLYDFKNIYRLSQKKQISYYIQQKVTTVRDHLYSAIKWPWSFIILILSLTFNKIIFKKEDETSNKQFENFTPDNSFCEENLEYSDDELLACNLSFGEESRISDGSPGPFINSTPSSHIKRKCLLSRFKELDEERIESNRHSFNESSFSSLEMSNDDLLRVGANEQTSQMTCRNLLSCFNSAEDDDDDDAGLL